MMNKDAVKCVYCNRWLDKEPIECPYCGGRVFKKRNRKKV